ncbi:hypothetical protein Cni_G28857 [Canna indica]|uniref:separase n=1 Tax=Canna indica TaxID=4628 RepID=A0AAQ3QTH0_9LILI|nr:hypothetical protein Cni_G28857 [Canna indica]
MDADADALLDALKSCDHRGLYERFASFLLPFDGLVSLHSHNPNPVSTKNTTISASSAASAPKKRGPKKKKQEPDPVALRPLAKRFLPFIRGALKFLPSLLRRNPKSPSVDLGDHGAVELIAVFWILLDCLSCIAPCLAGKPYSVHLQRVRLVVCLEDWGKYAEAEEEALMLLCGLSTTLVEAAPLPKSRKGKISGARCYIPDPTLVGADDPEVTIMVIEVITVLTRCAYKNKIRKEVTYDRIIVLIDQVQPWLRFLDPETLRRYHNFLVNTLYKCSLFLLEDYTHFEEEMVRHFCLRMLEECTNSYSIDLYPSIAIKITSSVDVQWAGGSSLFLDILRVTLESILCSCKVGLLKPANEFLEFLSYFASRICVGNIGICRSAAKLLYEQVDVLQVSLPVASVLSLYATGLQFKFSIIQANQSVDNLHISSDGNRILLLHDGGNDLQRCSVLLDTLASSYHASDHANGIFSEKNSTNVLDMTSKSGKLNSCMQTHGQLSLVSYIDALEFLCKPIVDFANTAWKNLNFSQAPVTHSDTLVYALKGLHQFSDLMLATSRCNDISERVQQRLNECHKTLLQVVLAAFKISLLISGSYEKSVLVIKDVISSTWIEPQELKFLISAITNIGAVCYDTGRLEKASEVLQLCLQTIWTYVKLIYGTYLSKKKGANGDTISKDCYKDAINDALGRIAMIIDVLYNCGVTNIKDIVVKSLRELSATEDIFCDMTGLLTLMKQWVKILCKEFKDIDLVDKAPVLYFMLLDCHSTWSKNLISRILEQERTAYELMESRNPNFCQEMELKVMNILLDDVYTSKDYNLQRSRILIRKGRTFRARGTEGLSKCLECLSEAISLLRCISADPFEDAPSVAYELALAYILYAQCAQEANHECNVILHNVHCALTLWSSMNVQGRSFTNNHPEWGVTNILPLLCSIVDLMSLKGCLKFQIEICMVMIRFCKLESILLDKCISMLWMNRRLSHSLCISPIDESFLLNISEQYSVNVNSLDYWVCCLKDHQSSQCMLLLKLLPSDSVCTESSGCSLKRPFDAEISIEEVKNVASSLISEVPLRSQSAFLAAYLYQDLSEKLFSNGRYFEALSYAQEALRLRTRILRRKFIYTNAEQFAKPEPGGMTQSRKDHICLEAMNNIITDVWPDRNKSCNLDEPILSPWIVLRCYLESTLQVGIIHESIGNGAEAKYLFSIGKDISYSKGFPFLAIAFTMLLGRVYRKIQMWDFAENEFKYAKKLLVEYENVISCDHCKITFEANIDMEVGDLSRNLFGKGVQINSMGSLSHALSLYRLAVEKLELAETASLIKICGKADNDTLLSAHAITEGRNIIQHISKFCTPIKDRASECCICPSLNCCKNAIHSGCAAEKPDELSVLNIVGGKSQVKKVTRKSSRCLAKDNNQDNPKRKLSSNRATNVMNAKSVGVDSKSNGSVTNELCRETLSCAKLPKQQTRTSKADNGGKEECGCNKLECWRCLVLQVMESGSLQNIIHLKWECHRRHLLLMLLLKIAKCLGIHCGKHGVHKVHEVFGQCISVMFDRKSLKYCGMPDFFTVQLIFDESLGDFFRMERAAILYHMSWFCLKDIISEHHRTICCSLSKIQMPVIISWLLRAFILCQECPLLFQKVSQLVSSIFLLSTLDCSFSVPVQTESLSLNHWAAYFHQASIGTYLHWQSYAGDKTCSTQAKGFSNASMTGNNTEVSKFFRFAPEKLVDLEEHVTEFFKSLPSIPVICISILGGHYTNLIGEMLLLPSFFPAWLLLSRLVANDQPIVMLLPVDLIQEEIQLEGCISGLKFSEADAISVKQWVCPWGYSVVDCVLPSFKQLLEDNFSLLSNSTFPPTDKLKIANWWSERTKLNNSLNTLLRNVESSWLGPWSCLLLGERSVTQSTDIMVQKLISALKFQGVSEINYSLINAILNGSKSVADAESCICQLLLYKGHFGCGACCGKERFRAFSASPQTAAECIHGLIKEALSEHEEHVDREPVIIVLDSDVQMLPWENLPILRSQEVYRMPSVSSIFLTLQRSCSHHKKDKAFGTIIPAVDPFDVYYLLNPTGEFIHTQVEFEQWFKNQEWEGRAGNIPTTEELILALQKRDLFLYFGHGSGTQYISEREIKKLDHCAAPLLMGCSSGSLERMGCYDPQGAPLSYLLAGSPCVIANLWDVTDKDIDRFGKALLKSWLDNDTKDGPLVKQMSCMGINTEVSSTSTRTRRKAHKEKSHDLSDISDSKQAYNRNRIASFMSDARESCKLPLLVGAAPVCYGVPTVIWKRPQS